MSELVGPIEVLRRMLDAFESGRLDGVAAVIDDGYLDHQGVGTGPLVGMDGFAAVVAVVQRVFPGLSVDVEGCVADADTVAARLCWRYGNGDGVGIERRTIEYLSVRDGRAIEHWGASLDPPTRA